MSQLDYINEPDYHYDDFDANDFEVGIKDRITDFYFRLLPVYFKMNDTYKDGKGRGLLERYLGSFDPEILDHTFPVIENYLNIIDVRTCNGKYLTHLSDILGNPPDIFDDPEKYRNLLAYVVSIYKIKGSIESYKLFFDILGFNMELEEVSPFNQNSIYDNDGVYDSEEFEPLYDKDVCQTCSYYDITLYYKDENKFDIDLQLINNIREAIIFNEPINAKLRRLTIGFNIYDDLLLNISDSDIISEEIISPRYDVGNEYDNDLEYEEP